MSAEDFAAHWLTLIPVEIRDRRGGTVTDRYNHTQGAEWRTKGALSGGGRVRFSSANDPNGSHEITLEHNYSARVDWNALFRSLTSLFEPSHAMIHVFTDQELEMVDKQERFAFNGPIAGEPYFTSWIDSSGDWRRPDSFQLEEHRRYRFLPELAWANVLGREFDNRYDAVKVAQKSAVFELVGASNYIQITDKIADVVNNPTEFFQARAKLKEFFVNDVFRAPQKLGLNVR